MEYVGWTKLLCLMCGGEHDIRVCESIENGKRVRWTAAMSCIYCAITGNAKAIKE